MPLISMCIVEPTSKGAINATTFQIPDFSKEVVIRIALAVGQNEVLSSLNDPVMCNELFAYIRSLHTHFVGLSSSSENKNTDPAPTLIRGGKTFCSKIKPLLTFLRYRSEGTIDDMMEDFSAIMALEAFAVVRGGTTNPLVLTVMSIPRVMKELQAIKATTDEDGKKRLHLNLRGHEFDKKILDMLFGPPVAQQQ